MDGSIRMLDPRTARSLTGKRLRHAEPICSLRWSPHSTLPQQLASGGSSSLVVWDLHRGGRPLQKLHHGCPVKAFAWAPQHRNLMATGGADLTGHLRTWDVSSGKELRRVATGSEVCQLEWSKAGDALVTAQGWGRDRVYSVCVWSHPGPHLLAKLPNGHKARPAFMAMSPDGQCVATGAGQGDDTIRVWKVLRNQGSMGRGGAGAGQHSIARKVQIR